jgi:hypothetical protein
VDDTNDTFQYQLVFTAANSGKIGVDFLSDNTGTLYVNGVEHGTNAGTNTDGVWYGAPDFNVTIGQQYVLDLVVNNAPGNPENPTYQNPTGARVELTGSAVPDGGATLILLGLAFGGLIAVRRFMAAGVAPSGVSW